MTRLGHVQLFLHIRTTGQRAPDPSQGKSRNRRYTPMDADSSGKAVLSTPDRLQLAVTFRAKADSRILTFLPCNSVRPFGPGWECQDTPKADILLVLFIVVRFFCFRVRWLWLCCVVKSYESDDARARAPFDPSTTVASMGELSRSMANSSTSRRRVNSMATRWH